MCDLGAVLPQIEPLLRRLVRRGITFRMDIPPTDTMVRIDRVGLTQVLIDLVANRSDAIESKGTITVWSRQTLTASPGDPTSPRRSWSAIPVVVSAGRRWSGHSNPISPRRTATTAATGWQRCGRSSIAAEVRCRSIRQPAPARPCRSGSAAPGRPNPTTNRAVPPIGSDNRRGAGPRSDGRVGDLSHRIRDFYRLPSIDSVAPPLTAGLSTSSCIVHRRSHGSRPHVHGSTR